MSLRGVRCVLLLVPSGYGIAARRAILPLRDAGVPVTLTPMTLGDTGRLWYQPFLGPVVGDAELDALCNRPIDHDMGRHPYPAGVLSDGEGDRGPTHRREFNRVGDYSTAGSLAGTAGEGPLADGSLHVGLFRSLCKQQQVIGVIWQRTR